MSEKKVGQMTVSDVKFYQFIYTNKGNSVLAEQETHWPTQHTVEPREHRIMCTKVYSSEF